MYVGFAILAQAGIHPLEHLAMTYKAIGGGGVDASLCWHEEYFDSAPQA